MRIVDERQGARHFGRVTDTLLFYESAPSLQVSQAGLVNNLNDGMVWGLFPLYFDRAGLSVAAIGTLAALYPAVWGVGQLVTGALSDRIGRKWLIVYGMSLQALANGLIAATAGFALWALGAVLLGVGTAMVYPTLLAAIGDVAHPAWRASSVGVYRLWRDAGFAIGALLADGVADLLGLAAAILVVAAITAMSGGVVAARMYETHRPHDRAPLPPGTKNPRSGGWRRGVGRGRSPRPVMIGDQPPLLRPKRCDEASLFHAQNLLREGRRQRGLPESRVPKVCQTRSRRRRGAVGPARRSMLAVCASAWDAGAVSDRRA